MSGAWDFTNAQAIIPSKNIISSNTKIAQFFLIIFIKLYLKISKFTPSEIRITPKIVRGEKGAICERPRRNTAYEIITIPIILENKYPLSKKFPRSLKVKGRKTMPIKNITNHH